MQAFPIHRKTQQTGEQMIEPQRLKLTPRRNRKPHNAAHAAEKNVGDDRHGPLRTGRAQQAKKIIDRAAYRAARRRNEKDKNLIDAAHSPSPHFRRTEQKTMHRRTLYAPPAPLLISTERQNTNHAEKDTFMRPHTRSRSTRAAHRKRTRRRTTYTCRAIYKRTFVHLHSGDALT